MVCAGVDPSGVEGKALKEACLWPVGLPSGAVGEQRQVVGLGSEEPCGAEGR